MLKLVLLRHGQSIWNLESKFTGWTDVDLSNQGIVEAHQAGNLLRAETDSRHPGYDQRYCHLKKATESVADQVIETLQAP